METQNEQTLTEDLVCIDPYYAQNVKFFESHDCNLDSIIHDDWYLSLDMEGRVAVLSDFIMYNSNLHINEYAADMINGTLDLMPYGDSIYLKDEDQPVSAEEIAIRLCQCKCDEDIWDLMLKGVGSFWEILSLYRGVIKFDPEFPISVGEVAASPERACKFATYVRNHGGPDFMWTLQYDENNNLKETTL